MFGVLVDNQIILAIRICVIHIWMPLALKWQITEFRFASCKNFLVFKLSNFHRMSITDLNYKKLLLIEAAFGDGVISTKLLNRIQ